MTTDEEKSFPSMRVLLLSRPTTSQSRATKRLMVVDQNNKQVVRTENQAIDAGNTKRTINKKQKDVQVTNCLILHFRHEMRFTRYKRDLHQVWLEVFLNTPASEVKVIVGSRNNRDAKSELVQKRPDPSLLILREKTCK